MPVLMAAVIIMGLSSCFQDGPGGKPRSSGTTSELLVVTDTKELWNGPLGDTIRAWFSRPMQVLPQNEPMYDMLNVAAADFGEIFQKFHIILIVKLDTSLPSSSSETLNNAWSEPQRVITVKAPDTTSLYEEFRKNKSSYLKLFDQLERDRIRVLNQMSGDLDLTKRISSGFGLAIDIPGGFYVAKEAPGFIWLRHREAKAKQDIELGIMIYFTEYTDTAQLKAQYILNWRNIMTRQHIPGETEGSYMKVANEFIPPLVSEPQDFPVGYATEIRGLWDVQNDYMGGPFLIYTFVDQKRNRVVSLDGYIYNPNELKRNFLRQLESIFHSTRIDQ